MTRPSGRIVIPSLPADVICVVEVTQNETQTVAINMAACKSTNLDLCIDQAADKTFQFVDSGGALVSGASEINFFVWANSGTGTLLISKSLSGGSIIVPNDTTFTLSISNTESAALTPGMKYCTAWVTTSSGKRLNVGKGGFDVIDTRGFDA